MSQRFRLSTEIYLPKEVQGSEHASDYYSKTPNPTVRVTRWMANLPESTLTKSEFSQVLTFANTNGEEVHAPIVRNYTLLHVKPADHGINEFGLGPSELPVSGLENPFGFGGPQQPRVTPKSLYYDFLLTKEEEAEVYKNFHESGEVYFMRNGEKITPHEMTDHFEWDGDENAEHNPYTPGVYTPEQTLPTVENNKLAGFRMLLEYKGNKKWTGVVGFTDKEVQNGVTLPKSWVGENPETGITIARQHFIYETTAKPTIHELPTDSPSVTPEMREVTRYIAVTDNGEIEVKPAEEGTHEAPMYVGNFQYNGKTVKEDGVTTHYYDRSVGETPENAPISDVNALDVTRFVTIEANGVEREIAPTVEGALPAPTFIGEREDYFYSKKTTVENHITTHYYVSVEKQVPGDFPTVEIPKKVLSENPTEVPIAENEALEITRWVTVLADGSLKEIKPAEKGTHAASLFIGSREDYHYNGKTTLEESVTTHYYDAVEKGIPGDAPVAENPEKVFTEVPNEAPVHELPERVFSEVPGDAPIHELPERVLTEVPGEAPIHELPEKILTEIPSDAPIHEIPEKILTEVPNEAPVQELTELVVTEVPKDAPVLELEELKIPEEPKKEETPTPAPSVIKTEVPRKELPKTGQTETGTLQALGAILGLAALGLTMKSKKQED